MRRIHLWAGLLGCLWFAALGLTGVLLNHPELIENFSVKRSLLPGDYRYRAWNRSSLRGAVPMGGGKQILYGEPGAFLYGGEGKDPVDYSRGLPVSAYRRDVRAMTAVGGAPGLVFAGTRGGLYARDVSGESGEWRPVSLGEKAELVVDVVDGGDYVFALTRSDVFAAPVSNPTAFEKRTPGRIPDPSEKPDLFRLVFDMHSGELWGLPGRLIMDLLGIVMAGISISGALFWYKKKRKSLTDGLGGKIARKGLKWHIKIGILLSPVILFSALTGIFQRPPFLIAIAGFGYPSWAHPAPQPVNPWHDKLRKALYDPARDTLVISASDGLFETKKDELVKGKATVWRIDGGAPISVMGATVFKPAYPERRLGPYLVGSMSGLYTWDRAEGIVRDVFTGLPPQSRSGPPVGSQSAMGFANLDGRWVWSDYRGGLFDFSLNRIYLPMPESLKNGGEMSLWHALFELHNGRMFDFLLGWWSWVVVPLGGLAVVAVTFSGIYERLVRRRRGR